MKNPLSSDKRATLAATLKTRQQALERQMALHQQGLSRVEHARETLQQDGDDAPQRASDREVDQALADLDLQSLAALTLARRRLEQPDYGLCEDCSEPIPFERLRIEPEALRCVACETLHEGHHDLAHERTL